MSQRLEHQYITVIAMDTPIGKLYKTNAGLDGYDPNNPKIQKITAYSSGAGWGRTYYAPDVQTLKTILTSVQPNPNSAIILGYVKGTEPMGDNSAHGEDYRLISKKDLLVKVNDNEDKLKKPQLINGVLHATRSTEMFTRSTWFAFDLDLSPDMPNELREIISTTPYVDLLEDLCPQLIGRSHLAVSSASSRVSINGKALSQENSHIYYQCQHPTDLPRYAASMLVRSLSTKYGYTNPARDIESGEIDESRNGSHSSIFDRAVFSTARIMFEGAPRIDLNDPHTQDGSLQLHPSKIEATVGEHRAVDTIEYLAPTPDEQDSARMVFSTSGKSFQVTNSVDLQPHLKIEVKEYVTNKQSVITMLDFVNGNIDRYRAQNPFKPSSSSWSAFLSKADQDGNPCRPFLHSIEFGKFEYNDVKSKFKEYLDEQVRTGGEPVLKIAPAPPSNTAPAPPPGITENKPSDAPLMVNTEHRQMVNFKTGQNLNTYPLPSDLSEDHLATHWVDRYFGRGGDDLLVQSGSKHLHFWANDHWEGIHPDGLKTLLFNCAIEGGVKNVTSSKINSIFTLATIYARRTMEVPALPTHMIPLKNGIMDFSTGTLIPHTKDFFYTEVKDFEYNPDIKSDNVLASIVEEASMGDPVFVRQFKQLGAYLISGGDNIAQKIIFLDGAPRAGKSLVAQTISAIAASTLNIEIADLPSPKVLMNIPNKALLLDDDAHSPPFQTRAAVTGIIKKLVGGAYMDIQQLYTSELFEAYLNPKVAICCNGLPALNDSNGAVHDRTEIISFDVTHAGKEDIGLGERMRQPEELSASLNYLMEGYQDLLEYNGYGSVEEFNQSKQKSLKFIRSASSEDKLKDSLNRAHQLLAFFEHKCERGDGSHFTASTEEVEARVRDWAMFEPDLGFIKKYGRNSLRREIRNTLLRQGLTETKVWHNGKSVRGFKGIRLAFNATGV